MGGLKTIYRQVHMKTDLDDYDFDESLGINNGADSTYHS